MKLKNIKEVEEFRKVIHACAGDVYLKSQDGDVFNLKSALSEYIALGQLLSEQGDNLELFADRRRPVSPAPREPHRGNRTRRALRHRQTAKCR